ncbi:NADPH-dependent 7-cyano-7-deazaguanine reductase QueF [Salicola sp. Rm-C-2C1-2]|uniref:NADPH-dependent 7-cyano-7-deazaguanine reductase QueF n=1 Tax=Salicola sp. Rm-C-2C1-2 TaxID=3141321 RepID=UPI0032E42CBC
MHLDNGPLGRTSDYPERYDPSLLYPVPRADARHSLGLADGWPWHGEDRWQAWELSWLRPDGVPRVATAEFRVPAHSPNLVESKSLKLYLNSLNGTPFENADLVRATVEQDLSGAACADVSVVLADVDAQASVVARPEGAHLIDDVEGVIMPGAQPLASLRSLEGDVVTETLCSHLLRSLCPVTGQPDWATLMVHYTGARLRPEALLGYIIGYRDARGFHEACVERIFMDLEKALNPERLSVGAFYTRRGGLDINPWRSTHQGDAPPLRLLRQ